MWTPAGLLACPTRLAEQPCCRPAFCYLCTDMCFLHAARCWQVRVGASSHVGTLPQASSWQHWPAWAAPTRTATTVRSCCSRSWTGWPPSAAAAGAAWTVWGPRPATGRCEASPCQPAGQLSRASKQFKFIKGICLSAAGAVGPSGRLRCRRACCMQRLTSWLFCRSLHAESAAVQCGER
jgi:hypothetical protein